MGGRLREAPGVRRAGRRLQVGCLAWALAACASAPKPPGNGPEPERHGVAPASTDSKRAAEREAREPKPESDDIELVHPGTPPRRQLRYRFESVGEARYVVRTELVMLEPDSTFTVGSWAGLSVARKPIPGEESATFHLRLGPLDAQRWSSEAPVVTERDESVVEAEIKVDARGAILVAERGKDEVSEALAALWDSLVERDVMPAQSIGVGARWKHRRELPGGHVITSEVELIGFEEDTLTLRVWREQRDRGASEASLMTVGEWTVALSSWPPLGIDRVHATQVGPDGRRLESSFSIGAERSEP